jgi:hypothetical protein
VVDEGTEREDETGKENDEEEEDGEDDDEEEETSGDEAAVVTRGEAAAEGFSTWLAYTHISHHMSKQNKTE